MNPLKIFSAILILILCGFLPLSCSRMNPCGDLGPVRNFNTRSFVSFNTDLLTNPLDTVNYFTSDSSAIAIRPDSLEFVNHTPPQATPQFTTRAYACSPAEPTSLNRISKISVTALSDFEYLSAADLVKSGTDITDRFDFRSEQSGTFRRLTLQNSSVYNIHSGGIMMLRFSQKPYKKADCRFEIVIEMDDNTVHKHPAILRVK